MREPEPPTIEAAAAGDRDAFAELVRAYQDPVWRFLSRLTGDSTLAEDLTQETFLRVHRGLDGFGGRSRFSTWVFGIARNTGLDAIRRRDRRPRIVASLSGRAADRAAVAAPPVHTDRLGLSTELRSAIASLPVTHREALLLVEVLGLTYREVATVTDVAEGTVKSRIHHARRSLHRWLCEAEHPGDDGRSSREV